MADNNIISSSKKVIYDKLIDIAQKYTDIEDTDYLKTGLFGYITEALAAEMRDSAFHKEMLYNEMFLNTAVMPQSVYNWAKMFNIEINKATPAYANITIKITLDTIDSFLGKDYPKFSGLISDSLSNALILDRDDPIIAGDYYFTLEHSILITKNSNGTYSAKYIDGEPLGTSYQTLTNKSLLTVAAENELKITARAYQYKITKITRYVNSASFLSKIQRYNFKDQFAGAKLFYELPGGSEEQIEIRYSNIASASLIDGKRYAYYNLNNSNELEINFKIGDSNFLPVGNSKINLYLYTTKGGQVSSKFSGDAFMNISNEELKSLPIIIQFNDSLIIGGNDMPDISTVKETIINKISTRDTIITESDLNTYFNILTGLIEDINSGKVTFVKKRDDVLRRIFSAYILLRDGRDESDEEVDDSSYISKCIPTTTADISVSNIKGNTDLAFPKITYNQNTGVYVKNDNPGKDFYFSPFYIYVFLNPINKIKYIYNLTDDTVNAVLDSNGTDYSIVPLTFNLYRGVSNYEAEKAYHLTLKFISTTEISNITKAQVEINGLKAKDENKDEKDIELNTTDAATLISELDTESNTYTNTLSIVLNVADSEFNFESNASDFGSNIYLNGYSSGIKEISPVKIILKAGNIKVLEFSTEQNNKQTSDGVKVSGLQFFRNLDDIMTSDMIVADGERITIKDVPLIHSSYIPTISSGSSKHEYFIKQLFNYANILKENLEKLETSTSFDLKFYNTYGPSRLYNSLTTNIKLELQIQMVAGISSTDRPALKKEIISYIRKYIDGCNTDKTFYVSNLLSKLQDTNIYGKYITGIIFAGLNDTYNQAILAENLSTAESVRYPLEWFNLDKEYLNINNDNCAIQFIFPD